VGVLSHFSNTEDVTEQSYARQQMETFERGLLSLQARFPEVRWLRHFAASAATLVLPDARYDAVRVGISLYGLWPSAETKVSMRVVQGTAAPVKLLPVMSIRCRSQALKWLEEGSYVGYGCTYRCDQRTRVAVLPVGYFDGYPRLMSGKAHVLVHGQRCRVLGRVMMNHLVVDVTHVRDESEVLTATLLGQDGKEVITAEMLADWAQTISYEIVTGVGAHLRRTVV
jgi:alanine racemase